MQTKISFFDFKGNYYISTLIGDYKADSWLLDKYRVHDYIYYKKLFNYLYQKNLKIDTEYLDKAKKIFINELSAYFPKSVEMLEYYFEQFELNKSLETLSFLLKNYRLNDFKKFEKSISELSYKDFLYLLKDNIDDIDALSNLLEFANESYVEKEDTLELLSKTNFSFSNLGFFKKRNLLTQKQAIKNMFSFLSQLPKKELRSYIKNDEHPLFIDIISELINKDYYNDLSFAKLFLPFKITLKEKIPFNIKILLIDDILKLYYSSGFEIFEKDVLLLSNELILKFILYRNEITIQTIFDKLCEYKHPILSDKEVMLNLIKQKCNVLPFINLDKYSKEELNIVKKYFNIDLSSDVKMVKLHQKLFGKYKFEYDNDEILTNGHEKSKFFNQKLKTGIEKFLFNFLLYGKDIEIIYDNYYEKYKSLIIKKYGEEKFKKLDDIYNFMKFILAEKKVNNEIIMPNLEMIYQKLNLTNMHVNHIKDLMCSIDPSYEEKINKFLMRQRNIALSKYNAIVRMHLDGINISEALSKIGLNKDELISQIIKMRNLGKKEKSTLINLLREEKYILTIGDILGLLQEMEENDYTIDEVLRLNGINKKYFYTIYKELIYTNPELHNKIKETLLNNKKRGFKKYIRLAYYITSLEFNDEEDFKNMFSNVDLDEMAINMEKINKTTLANKLRVIKQKISSKTKQIN